MFSYNYKNRGITQSCGLHIFKSCWFNWFKTRLIYIQSDFDVALGHLACTREFPELVDYWNMVL